MSHKNCDSQNRFRSKTIAFRMSPEESDLLNALVRISGYKKQDYLIDRVLQRDILVRGSPRTYKALKDMLMEVLQELKRIKNGSDVSYELTVILAQISNILLGFSEND